MFALGAADPRRDQHGAGLGITQRVGDQIDQDPLEQDAVAQDPPPGAPHDQFQALGLGCAGEFAANALEHRGQRQWRDPLFDDPGVQARDVEQRIEQVAHGGRGPVDLAEQLALHGAGRLLLEGGDEHAQRMHRLAQVVTRRGQESRLGMVGAFGLFLFFDQLRGGFLHARGKVLYRGLEAGSHVVDAAAEQVQYADGAGLHAHARLAATDPFDRERRVDDRARQSPAHSSGNQSGDEQHHHEHADHGQGEAPLLFLDPIAGQHDFRPPGERRSGLASLIDAHAAGRGARRGSPRPGR